MAVGLPVTVASTSPLSNPPILSPIEFSSHLSECIDPEVYRTRNDRSMKKLGHPEKYSGFTRAYWSIACNFCHKEVRFCCMCQGELKPVEKTENDGSIHQLQCTECNRVISMRFCSACGHAFEKKVVDARMEIPRLNVGLFIEC